MHRARSLRNRSRAVSLRARLPSKDPRTAMRTRSQPVDEQALSSLKKLEFQSADDLRAGKRPQDFCKVARPLLWAPPRSYARSCVEIGRASCRERVKVEEVAERGNND